VDETLKRMWPDGARSITSVTKRPVTAGMDFKTSIISLVENNLAMKARPSDLICFYSADNCQPIIAKMPTKIVVSGNPTDPSF